MHRPTKIFLSHTFLDKNPIKDRLITDLEHLNDVKLWRAETEIVIGDTISTKISQAISEADYFLQILGERQGAWTNLEHQLAVASEVSNQNIKIIKAIVGGIKSTASFLGEDSRGVAINFTGNYDEAFKRLCEIIRVNPSDSLIKFNLDAVVQDKPVFILSNEVNDKLIVYFSKNPDQLKTIDRRLFEELIAEVFLGFGYKVELTQKTRDGGRDIIAIKNVETEIKYLIECKRPDPGNVIGIKPVRELFGVKQDEKATKAILATTSYFSKDALQFFERNKWELEPKDFDGLMNWITLYKTRKNIV
jgi:HJR/Mrr/RecB family endonuclease